APFLFFAEFPDDPALSRAVSEGRRHEFAAFGWKPEDVPDPTAPGTFARSKLDWSEPDREPHRGLLQWHRRLIRLRRQCPELSDGRLDRVARSFRGDERWLVVERGRVTIAVNFADERRSIPLPADRPHGLLLSSHDSGIEVGLDRLGLPGHAVVVLGPEGP